MQQWARSVWLGQCAAAGNAHFRLAKVVEPRRYPARSLTRFARRRGPTRLLPALAPHRVPRNHCEEPVPLVLPNGHNTHPSVHGVRVSHSHEKRAPEPGKPAAKQAGCPPFRDGNSESPLRNQIFPHAARRHDRRSSWNACETRRLCPWRAGKSVRLFEPKVGKSKGRFICAYRSHRPRYRTPLPN